MRFTVSGTLDDKPVSLTWEDGKLSGSQAPLAIVEELVYGKETVLATPTGPGYDAMLSEPWVALITILNAIGRDWLSIEPGDVKVEGDMPAIDPKVVLPEGAVG